VASPPSGGRAIAGRFGMAEDYRRFWDRSLDALAEHLKTMQRPARPKARKNDARSTPRSASRKALGR